MYLYLLNLNPHATFLINARSARSDPTHLTIRTRHGLKVLTTVGPEPYMSLIVLSQAPSMYETLAARDAKARIHTIDVASVFGL